MESILWKIKAGRITTEEWYIVAPTFKQACDEAVWMLSELKGADYQADSEDIQSVDRLRSVRVVA